MGGGGGGGGGVERELPSFLLMIYEVLSVGIHRDKN